MAHGQHETRGSWILLICASILAAFGAFGIKSFSNIESSLIVGSVTSRLLVFLLAVMLAVVALKKINKRKILGTSRRQHPVVHLDESHAKQLQDSASDSNLFDATLAGIFFIGVERPRELRQRVVESYELGSRVLHQRVSIEGKIPRYVLERPGARL
jgi:hypothetical protein